MPFWRVSTERKQRMLFCVSRTTQIGCFRSNQSVNKCRKMVLGWRGGDELLNKVVIFVFFAYKKYSRSFVKLRLNPWCHMDYFTDLLATFLDVDGDNYIAVYGRDRALRMHQKYLNLCSQDERRSYGFGTTWGWVINDIIFIFGSTVPLMHF